MLGSETPDDLGQSFGATLTESEVRYLMAFEWAPQPRISYGGAKSRSLSAGEIAALEDWIRQPRSSERPEAGGRRPSSSNATRSVDGIPAIAMFR
jgi:glycerol-3-phosphate dehydrogenase